MVTAHKTGKFKKGQIIESINGMGICEYYLRTGDASVLPIIRKSDSASASPAVKEFAAPLVQKAYLDIPDQLKHSSQIRYFHDIWTRFPRSVVAGSCSDRARDA